MSIPNEFDPMRIFQMGVDYGQLLMELERDSEDVCDAFQGVIIDEKYSMPSNPAPRRMPHSDKWRKAKLESFYTAMEMIGKFKEKENDKMPVLPFH